MGDPTGSSTRMTDHTARKRLMIGGAGALMPLLLNLAVVDGRTVFADVTLVAVAGYSIRVVFLLPAGAVVAWMYEQETDLRKLFQLGIGAPSLILALQNGANAERHVQPTATPAVPAVPVLRAQPRETAAQQFWRGLSGSSNRGESFVALSQQFTNYSVAKRTADSGRKLGVSPTIFSVSTTAAKPRCVLVLKDWVDADAAFKAVTSARQRGVDAMVASRGALVQGPVAAARP